MLELEVNERLHFAAFHLDYPYNHHYKKQGVYNERCFAEHSFRLHVQACRKKMQHEAQGHECGHFGVAQKELREELGLEVCEYLPKHLCRVFKGRSGKEEPAEADEVKGEKYGCCLLPALWLVVFVVATKLLVTFVGAERKAVHRSPNDKVPRSPVPESAQEHGHELVEVHAPFAAAVAAHGDVEIVAKPRGEGYVPTAPKVGDGVALVGGAEVCGDVEPHPERKADGHVGIARKVAVELQRVAVYTEEVLQARVERRVVEDARHEVLADVVGDDAFLEKPHHDEPCAGAHHLLRNDNGLAELRKKSACAEYGAGEKGGEETYEEGKVGKRVCGLHVATVHVDDVAHGLEREEADADEQRQI